MAASVVRPADADAGGTARFDGTEVLAGLELGGIPIVTMLSQRTGLPARFVHRDSCGC